MGGGLEHIGFFEKKRSLHHARAVCLNGAGDVEGMYGDCRGGSWQISAPGTPSHVLHAVRYFLKRDLAGNHPSDTMHHSMCRQNQYSTFINGFAILNLFEGAPVSGILESLQNDF